MSGQRVGLTIPQKLYEEIKKRVEGSQGEFKNVEEYIEFVLTQVIEQEAEEQEQAYTAEEEEEMKTRLKRLGYL